jgi:hypothetical protein
MERKCAHCDSKTTGVMTTYEDDRICRITVLCGECLLDELRCDRDYRNLVTAHSFIHGKIDIVRQVEYPSSVICYKNGYIVDEE